MLEWMGKKRFPKFSPVGRISERSPGVWLSSTAWVQVGLLVEDDEWSQGPGEEILLIPGPRLMHIHLRGGAQRRIGQSGPARVHLSTQQFHYEMTRRCQWDSGETVFLCNENRRSPSARRPGVSRGDCGGPQTQKEDTEKGTDWILVSRTIKEWTCSL